ncbi:MAG: hypothetical protein OXE47_09890 [Gammaproteobacteria bacterium]|nr:hypothetical protein [Gammaproteobacteria bacterium]
MTEKEILELVFSIIGLIMVIILAFGASESHWIYPKLDRWLEKRKKRREQRRRAAVAAREVRRILSS